MKIRETFVYLHAIEPDPASATECPCCQFDAMMTVRIMALSELGVDPAGEITRCYRCWQERCECIR